jgi:hypothetical protein
MDLLGGCRGDAPPSLSKDGARLVPISLSNPLSSNTADKCLADAGLYLKLVPVIGDYPAKFYLLSDQSFL